MRPVFGRRAPSCDRAFIRTRSSTRSSVSLIATYGMAPAAGAEVLREVSQQTNIKLRTVAEALIGWMLGRPKPKPLGRELDAAVQRRSRCPGTQDCPSPRSVETMTAGGVGSHGGEATEVRAGVP
ncbi:ANTAR domain-containing protein [Streptomyces sp. NBC_01261]|uniref:ANTAR domain-containing protein n=1 Tax=Streptomyces sp. NBC_01261 TaxID=2903802 RepID=UPI003FCD8146